MPLNSGVQWCHHSHGFWYGCQKVSAGCAKCYAERDMSRYGRDFTTVTKSKSFDAPIKWLKSGKAVPGDRVFVCPWSDFFIEDADEWRADALAVVRACPELNFLILTKRIERLSPNMSLGPFDPAVYPNVWLGVSVENQAQANLRIPLLMKCKASIRWVSFEPLLEKVILSDAVLKLDWGVIGGESDPKNPRAMDPEWALSLTNEMQDAGIPVYFKQMGGSKRINGHWGGNELRGQVIEEFPKSQHCQSESQSDLL